uniref:Retrovirus-related Pol polyprotein from transposon TNT 1-94 n=1 Tax=Tanacetum cinerariifolium TaxID=118510 RepID=A0A6L2NNA1_TANCI|nr:retrovirus-related Pol polyprotein from transposon TNT 1-94 [Tanacetum cinerariifolium]
MIIKKDSEIVKAKVIRKSIALKSKKESSDEECLTSGSKDEEYAMAQRDFKKFFKIREYPKPPKDKNQRAFVKGSWSDSGEEDDENVKDETCLVAHASSEICLGVDLEPDEWIKDSGYSKHMMGNQKLFSTYKAYNGGNVIFGSNLRGNIIGKCVISNDSLKIDNVEHVDNLEINLLSIGQICDNKCRVTFSKHNSEITKDGKVIGRGIRKKGLYVMKLRNKPNDQICLTTIDENSTFWHRRLGHANMCLIQSLASKDLVRNLPKLKFDQHFCDACKIGKQAHASHKTNNVVSMTRYLELLHIDLFGPSAVRSYGGNRYTLVIVDDYSRKVEESLNVTFDETPPPSKTSSFMDDDLDEEKIIKVTEKKNLEKEIVDETLEIDEIVNIKESRNHPLENVIRNLNQRTRRVMSSPNHPTTDIKDAFSSNFPNYTTVSPNYFLASPGNISPDPPDNLSKYPFASPFYNVHAYNDVANKPPILPQDPITPLTLLTPSLVLPPSPLFDPQHFFVPKELLPPKKQIHPLSSSTTMLSNSSRKKACILVPPSFSTYTPTPPQIYELGKSSIKMRVKHHKKQVESILNYLEELSFHRIKKMEERLVNGRKIIPRDFDEILPKRISTSEAPAMTQATIRKLVADSVAITLKPQAVTLANTNNPNRNFGLRRTPIARKCTYEKFMSCQPFYFNGTEGAVGLIRWFKRTELVFSRSNCVKKNKVKFTINTLTEEALFWWNSFTHPIGVKEAYKIT